MKNAFAFVARYGPLVAAFALGVQALLPASGSAIAAQLVSLLSLFGVAPDPALVEGLGQLTAGGLALFGVARKVLALVSAYFAAQAPKP